MCPDAENHVMFGEAHLAHPCTPSDSEELLSYLSTNGLVLDGIQLLGSVVCWD